MCDAFSIPIATALLGVASTITTAEQANQQANAQAEYQEMQAKEYARTTEMNNQASVKEYAEQSAAESIKEMQEKASAAREKQAIQSDALQKKGTMMASTNAAGVAMDYLLADYGRQEANQKDAVDEQQSFNAVSHALNKESFQRKAQNTINSQQSFISQGVSSGSSAIGTILGIGSSALSGFNLWKKYDTDTGGKK